MEDNNTYEARLDKIFGNGSMWKHRSFRTILDPFSHEWSYTNYKEKIEILEKLVASGEPLLSLILAYKLRYYEQNRDDIATSVEFALIQILQYQLKK